MTRAIKDYDIVLLDQRGTGRSTPITRNSLTREMDSEQQASYLKCFRADSIAEDCERIREALDAASWTVLGQS